MTQENIISVRDLVSEVKGINLHQGLSMDVRQQEILGIVGGSGSGKSVLLRILLGLMPRKSGQIHIFGMDTCKPVNMKNILRRCGVLFQGGALFSSLTTLENIQLPMIEIAGIPPKLAQELALLKLDMVGLESSVALKYPAELSGGMIKRVALARALAIDAELLFLDEPTAGLDPIAAAEFDLLLGRLQQTLKLTVVMITHDLDSLHTVCNRVAVLADKKIVTGTIKDLLENPHPWIQNYFSGPRGRTIFEKVQG